MTFDDVLGPVPRARFIADVLGKEWLRLEGERGRFAHLAPWERINDALSRDRFSGRRIRLVKAGRAVPADDYLLAPLDENGSQVDMKKVLRHLRGGATLVFNAIDEVMPPLRTLCEELEELFRITVQANAYAVWKTDNGFDLHWDNHDTLILQIAGRKHWRVYGPTRPHPVEKDVAEAPKPTGDPVWEGDLHDGDVLYMPRGWWHVAIPKNEQSLHVTISLAHFTGSHLMRWLAQELKAEELIRADVPHLADEDAQEAYAAALTTMLSKRIAKDVIARFMRFGDTHARARPRIDLPADVTGNGTAMNPASVIRLTGDRELYLEHPTNNGQTCFTAMGQQWNCDRSLVPALHLLRGYKGTSLQTMLDVVPQSVRGALRLQLNVMASGGVITISNG
jgi:hypothetical protein